MSDSLTNVRWFRTLNILDKFNWEALWIEVDTSMPAERVIRVLENRIGEASRNPTARETRSECLY